MTSYDYHAPLDEAGNPTEKYFALQEMLKEEMPDIEQHEPRTKTFMSMKAIPLAAKVNLFEVLEDISTKRQASTHKRWKKRVLAMVIWYIVRVSIKRQNKKNYEL